MTAGKRVKWFGCASMLALGSAMCAENDIPVPDEPSVSGTTAGSISNILANSARFTVLPSLLERSGLLDVLDRGGEFTIFAPTDAAFAAMPNAIISAANFVSTGNPAQLLLGERLSEEGLEMVLEAHVVSGRITADQVVDGVGLETLAGSSLSAAVADPTPGEEGDEVVILNGRARLVQAELAPRPTNGVIHVIDSVFVPGQQLASSGVIDEATYPGTLAELVEATPLYETVIEALRNGGDADVLETLNDDAGSTLFIPTIGLPSFGVDVGDPREASDVAAAASSFGRLHVFEGELDASDVAAETVLSNAFTARFTVVDDESGLSVGGSTLLVTDVVATNGRVHVVGPPLVPAIESAADVITSRGEFRALLRALEEASLIDGLRDRTLARTVFAPTNEALAAFDALGIDENDGAGPGTGLLEQLGEAGELENLLLYHVSADGVSEVLALADPSDPTDMRPPLPTSIETLLSGESVDVSRAEGRDAVRLNDEVGIASTDVIDLTPGDTDDDEFIVVHTVDGVLIPSSGVTVPSPEPASP